MGWTSYQATYYKNGKVDRKAECDAYWEEGLNSGHFKVLKSSMVGTVYYAAIQALKKRVRSEGDKEIYEDIPENERKTFAVVFLTSIDNKSYYNFSYKDMDESMGPGQCDCPKGILDLLSPTDYEFAIEWRKNCRNKLEKKKDLNSLKNLPVGTKIEWTNQWKNLTSGLQPGVKKILIKTRWYNKGKSYWSDGSFKYPAQIIGENYIVIKEDK